MRMSPTAAASPRLSGSRAGLRGSLLALSFLFLLPATSSATLIGDAVLGCFSSSPCSAGSPGVFTSATAVVSQSAVEFTGSAGGFSIDADLLVFDGVYTLRLALSGPSSASLPGGYSIGFFDLDWSNPLASITGASTDTTFLFAEIDRVHNLEDCEGDPFCEVIVSQNNATAKEKSVLPVASLVTTSDSILITLDAVTASPVVAFGTVRSFIDVLVTVPEPASLLLLGLGCMGLGAHRRGRSGSARSAQRREPGTELGA